MLMWPPSLKITYCTNLFSILTKHLSCTVAVTFAVLGVTAKVAVHSFPMDSKLVFTAQLISVAQSTLCSTLCDPMDHSTRGLPVHHQLPELTQTHVHQVSDAIQPSHPLSSPSPPAFNLSQHQGLFK